MCVCTLKNIELHFVTNKKELLDFPDIIEIVGTNISTFYESLRQNLQNRIINFLFLKSDEVKKTIMAKIIKEVKAENKKNEKAKDMLDDPEYFFQWVSLNNHFTHHFSIDIDTSYVDDVEN
jgi:hypothetical protein